ncbi:biopolymer transporter ExbD [Thiomicrospira cyclica]|jgi:biopolymer transport protein ExbD|uniref:Biopolymer transport protein ExbD/TolR n=1 Tax=Thiomicrospira cyclica (strain DSM 14477 / JCM 11371 / ALM1) TaxID=717773 RepID=F6DA97_THICA|nr:biopolymer transporter ExbD [Thiomicrospira cyclica]AEG31063.1 Biopolymer transport protein ExbD/TolR [Thiomicrospira cyclica ALM1]
MSLTSLIDVIFLLLLFFMLTTSFNREAAIAFNMAGIADTHSLETVSLQTTLLVQVSGDILRLEQDIITIEALLAMLQQTEQGIVLLSFDDSVNAQTLVELMARIGQVKGWQPRLVEAF